jgi:hypothetical protein
VVAHLPIAGIIDLASAMHPSVQGGEIQQHHGADAPFEANPVSSNEQ